MQLSKLESEMYEALRRSSVVVFRIRDLCLLLNFSKIKAYNLVKALKRKKIIKRVGNGFLSFADVNEFLIATTINYPSYLSFWTALNYYGFSDQTPNKIFLATTKYTKEINGFKYITVSKNRFFGYTKIGDLVIAEKEKAIIDSLLFPKYSGGIKEIKRSLQSALKELNYEKLLNYAFKVKNKAVLRRLGFILESLNYKKDLKKIKDHIGKGYELLDPGLKRKNNLNKKWLLDVNC